MITISTIFDHRNRTPKGSEGPVEIRITINRKVWYINTSVRVSPSQWMCGAVVNRIDADELNERICIILKKINAYVNDCMRNGDGFDIDRLRADIKGSIGRKNCCRDFLDWCNTEINEMQLADGTRKHYGTVVRQLEKWAVMKSWTDVNTENIMKLDSFLHSLPGRKMGYSPGLSPRISDGAVYTYHKCLKALLYRAVMKNKINSNPYEKLRGKFKKGDGENVEYLTEDEMKRVENLDIQKNTMLEAARDLFIFQMYTGMSYSDAVSFTIDRYRFVDGRWIARNERRKTGVAYVSRLLPPAVRVLEKYGMSVPKIDNSDYNAMLKVIGSMAKIRTRMHSHLARHTFATFMLRNGVKIENLAKMMGHTNIIQTQRYAKVLALSVYEEFDNIAGILE